MRKAISILLAITAALSLSACSSTLDMKKVTGDWTVDTIDGKTISDFAAEKAIKEYNAAIHYNAAMNVSISEKEVTITTLSDANHIDTKSYKINADEDGFNSLDSSGNSLTEFTFNEENGSITFTQTNPSGSSSKYVLKKGTTNLNNYIVDAQTEAAATLIKDADSILVDKLMKSKDIEVHCL